MAYISAREAINKKFVTDCSVVHKLFTGELRMDDPLVKALVHGVYEYWKAYIGGPVPFPDTFALTVLYNNSHDETQKPDTNFIEMSSVNPMYIFQEKDLPILPGYTEQGFEYKFIGWVGSDDRIYKPGDAVICAGDIKLTMTALYRSADDPEAIFPIVFDHMVE